MTSKPIHPRANWRVALGQLAAVSALLVVCLALSTQPTAAQSNSALAYTFTTFAGKAARGSADGVGDAAQFDNPEGVAVDSAGDLYVADWVNNAIRKVTAAGVVSTLAGFARSSGSADGIGSNARFNEPHGIAVDNAGNLYVADTHNHTIRKITPVGTNWVVSTIAGLAGNFGNEDGTGGNARFNQPRGIAVDSAGGLYVADTGNHTIRKITPVSTNWVVSTFAGLGGISGSADGTGGNARFNEPNSIAVDRAGNLYVADTGSHTIRKITAAGVVSTIAGLAGIVGSADGTGSTARFYYPIGIAVDSVGNVYVGDTINYTIRKVTAAGVVSTFAGLAGSFGSADGTGSNARFFNPTRIAVDSAGNLYVTDSSNHSIRKITSGGVVSTLAGPAGSSGSANGTGNNARFNYPSSIAVDSSGNLYVTDTINHTIRKVTAAGVVSTLAGLAGGYGNADGTGSDARFNYPSGIAADRAGNLYVGDCNNHTIRKITAAGVVSTFAGLAGSFGSADGTSSNARFSCPFSIAADNAGNLYVVDLGNYTIRKITPVGTDWVVSTIAGLAGIAGSADGAGGNARFDEPRGIAVDSGGNVYVADTINHTIRKVTLVGTNWVVSTIAGLAGIAGSADGAGGNARFDEPDGIAVDSAGNVYVADFHNNTIRKITLSGVVSTFAGLAGAGNNGSADGTGSNARFTGPEGIAVDNAGNLYVADTYNHTIRKGVFTQYTPIHAVPYSLPPMNGQLTVTLLPEANGKWRFPWEFGWHNSGYTASNLVAGNYPIEFRNVPGWLAIPLSDPVQVTNGGTVSITKEYYPTLNDGDANSTPGTLTVTFGLTPPTGAGWRFLGETTPYFTNVFTTNLPPDTYLIEFAFVSGRVKPPSQTVLVNAGLPSFLSINYPIAPDRPANVLLPFPVPANQVNDETTYPFGFNGQLQSDNGYGSGVAVDTHVVLTAGHLVFSDATLSYVSHAHWFFRRDAGVREPLPQAARSFFVLSGYASRRTNDYPVQSTPQSRNLDVAALYFPDRVAGGGHGGYLPSYTVPNTWLTSTALKMLVGYPVDGSQFGDASIVPGKMYQTEPQPYPLSIANDAVPEQQQVYVAPWFFSYPGNSGGPLYVQLNGSYYPAGVYLGSLFNGNTPYASAVRAIDSSVVNLITNAVALGESGTNFTGGGVITIVPSQNVGAKNPVYLQVQLAPPSALRAGAAWRLSGDTAFGNSANYTRQVTTTSNIDFKPIPGWNLPANQTLSLVPNPNAPTVVTGFYRVFNPTLVLDVALGLGMTGTIGTTYRLERRISANVGAWMAVSTNTIDSNGFNLLLPKPPMDPPTGFYRLNWLTNF